MTTGAHSGKPAAGGLLLWAHAGIDGHLSSPRPCSTCYVGGLIYRTETTTKKWKTEKLRSKKTDMLRNIGKQSGESVESVKKK